MTAQILFYLSKGIEALGLLMMPVALYFGLAVEGSAGMGLEMRYLAVGFCLFYLGRALESATGREP